MDKEQARAIVKNTFENPFDKGKFTAFTKNLLNHVEEAPFSYKGNLIPDAYEQHVSLLERIGKYTDGEHKIDILIVKLKKETSIERARTMQRNFIARYLNGSRGGELKDAALVAFVSPNNEDWRFSLVKMDYRFEEGKDGKVKVKEEFTPARRWSFLVGANENSHTAKSRLVPIIADDDHNPTLEELEEAFNIEKATKEFFGKYRDLFLWTKEELDNVVSKFSKVKADFEAKGVNTVDFSKKLLGQIVFLYFLQKKGWFGVARDADWGTGPKNFLRLLFDKQVASYGNFFNDILEPLFYNTLAVPRTDDYSDRFNCKIPFLNGGLFDPINDYDWIHTDICLPDALFSNKNKTSEGDIGAGILDIFDRYNFTVKEDEPLEKEVAVDPEMLGKVFENLLEVKDRKSKGTYYTPREIVHYMCQESLISHLETKLKGRVTRQDIETLIKYGETVIEHDAHISHKGRETKTYLFKLPQTVRDNAGVIDDKLSAVRVCDPAVGSGAFLVGMMNEIVRTRTALTSYLDGAHDRSVYDFKRHAIQNCLYGVDIDPGAVEIAKLRLWLSLVVEEEDIKSIKPLPNLDYKIMQGNSLLEEYEGIKLIDERFLKRPVDVTKEMEATKARQSVLQKEYLELHSKNKLTLVKKTELQRRLGDIDRQLRSYNNPSISDQGSLGIFKPSEAQQKATKLLKKMSQFFEIAQKKEKDRLKNEIEELTWELVEATLKENKKTEKLKDIIRFRKANAKPFFLWGLHFAEIFQEKGGFDIVIGNPPWGIPFSKEDKAYFRMRFAVARGIIDSFALFIEKGTQLLHDVGIFSMILPDIVLLKAYPTTRKYILDRYRISRIIFWGMPFGAVNLDSCTIIGVSEDVENIRRQNAILTSTAGVGQAGTLVKSSNIPQQYFLDNKDFKFNLFWDPTSEQLKSKIEAKALRFNELFHSHEGIHSGNIRHKLFLDSKINNCCRPLIFGRNEIQPFRLAWSGKYVNYDHSIIDRKKGEYANLARIEYFVNPKIFVRRTGDYVLAAVDRQGFFSSNNLFVCIPREDVDLDYVAAILNSKLMTWYFRTIQPRAGRLFAELKLVHLNEFPITMTTQAVKNRLSTLAAQASKCQIDQQGQSRVQRFIDEIDELVFELYEITTAERSLIEKNNKK
ncbi:MAG: hypothetical protein MUP17_02085 [candidate division Zixibacteria bacterium]|nr:hypothetical protein [candidate division Zixibacteria bacterium]